MDTLHKLFTPDEARVILKWAEAHLDVARHNEKLDGTDTLFPNEITCLERKLRSATPSLLLGTLNTGMLMGFDIFDKEFPLQGVWDTVSRYIQPGMMDADEVDQLVTLTSFLEKSSLIKNQEPCQKSA